MEPSGSDGCFCKLGVLFWGPYMDPIILAESVVVLPHGIAKPNTFLDHKTHTKLQAYCRGLHHHQYHIPSRLIQYCIPQLHLGMI